MFSVLEWHGDRAFDSCLDKMIKWPCLPHLITVTCLRLVSCEAVYMRKSNATEL